jgi:hypothetical protein
MTTITTYICDRCRKEMPAADKFQVGFIISTITQYSVRSPIPQPANSADWCRACCNEMQLHLNLSASYEVTLSTSEKLEEIIRTIVKEAVEDQS